MLGIKDERDLHGANPLLAWWLAVEQGEKVSGEVAFRDAVPAKDDCAQARFMKRCVRAKSRKS